MIIFVWDKGFKKAYKKRIGNNEFLKKKFWEAIKLFSEDPFHPKLKTHKLTGKLSGLYAFKVAYDCRVIFRFISEKEVLLIDIGSHEEVY